ncbi:MAG: energy transducer TonB [Balneolia bacterium]|nr:energy transducer TonB [Balneolia bacterium]
MLSYRFIPLLFIIAAFSLGSCGSSNIVSEEDHIAEVQAEDVSEILFREPVMLGGMRAYFDVLRYPKSDRDRGREGTVVLAYTVSEQGLPVDIIVSRTSGFRTLDEHAVEALAQMRFLPSVRRGERMAYESTLPVDFRINQ